MQKTPEACVWLYLALRVHSKNHTCSLLSQISVLTGDYLMTCSQKEPRFAMSKCIVFCAKVKSSVSWATTTMGNGARPKRRTDKAGYPATTSPRWTVWRSIPGIMDRCHGTLPSTFWAVGSTAAFSCERARAVLARDPSPCDTREGCTTTE